MSPVKSIQTRFAGCHFRSRLEARWAVTFDKLGFEWEYEPQGFTVGNRLNLEGLPDTWNYLPDFWLPQHRVWVEVKGELSQADYRKLLSAAAYLSSNGGGGCGGDGDPDAHDVVVAGPIPRPGLHCHVPALLHMHKGDLTSEPWTFDTGWSQHYGTLSLANDAGEVFGDGYQLLCGRRSAAWPALVAAYTAARSARFEFGARGR